MSETFIITAIVIVVVIIISREFWCWFFKINETKKSIDAILAYIKHQADGTLDEINYIWECSECNTINTNSNLQCRGCKQKVTKPSPALTNGKIKGDST